MPPLTEAEVASRAITLGASEIAAVMGKNPYATKHNVWMAKMGLETFEGNEATELGNELEPVIAAMFCKRYGAEVTRGTHVVGPEPWMGATPDYHIVGGGLLECKLVGLRSIWQWGPGNTDKQESDQVPIHYLLQQQWQMLVTGEVVNRTAALMGTEFRTYTIRPHAGIMRAMRDAGWAFWRDYVLTKTPPPADGSDGATAMLKALYPRSGEEPVRAGVDLEEIAADLLEARLDADEAKTRKALHENRMKESLGNARGAFGDGWRLRWAETKSGTRPFVFDHDREKTGDGKAA